MGEREAKTQPVIIDSAAPLQLPPVCVCCGKPGTHAIVIKPTEPPTALSASQTLILEAAGLAVHPLGLVLAVKKLSEPKVSIPMCARCRFKHFLPGKNTIVFIILHIAFFVVAFWEGFKGNYGWMMLALLFAFICLVYIGIKNIRHDLQTLPVRVYKLGNKFRYLIYGGPLYYLIRRKPDPPAES